MDLTDITKTFENMRISASMHKANKLLFILMFSLFLTESCYYSDEQREVRYDRYLETEFEKLIAIRENKSENLSGWIDRQKDLIQNRQISSYLIQAFYDLQSVLVGKSSKNNFFKINNEIEEFFVLRLGAFYDVLFVDRMGVVFYSVKMEDDFRKSFATGKYSKTKLGELLKSKPTQLTFVDFEYYGASDEPAAFFVLPINNRNNFKGWLVFQLSTNHINKLLTSRNDLGRTGEAYLVNQKQLMLTESRFISDDTVLSKKIDTRAVRFQKGISGKEVIKDYRGVTVLSTFRVVEHGDASWRIIVEKDEDEVVSNYYMYNQGRIFKRLVNSIKINTLNNSQNTNTHALSMSGAKRVDLGEMVKSDKRGALYTSGVATCTGVAAYRVGGQFGYMAHVSPVDQSYDLSAGSNYSTKEQTTDLISLMIRRILYFEIKPSQIGQLRFCITAPHANSLKGIINKLMEKGILINQIKVAIVPSATSVSLYHKTSDHVVVSSWVDNSNRELSLIDFSKIYSLADLVKDL